MCYKPKRLYRAPYLKYLCLLLTKPIVQHPLSIAFVAPVILFMLSFATKLWLLLPIDERAIVDPLLEEGIIATEG